MKKILALIALIPTLALADRDSSGNFTFSSDVYPVVSGRKITASWANALMADIAENLSDSLSRRGEGGMLVPFRFAPGDASAPGVSFTNYTTSGFYVTGSADNPTLTLGLSTQPTLKVTKSTLYHNNYQIPLFSEAVFFFPGKMINNHLLARIGFTTLTRVQAGLIGLTAFAGTDPAATGSSIGTGGVVLLWKRTAAGNRTAIGHIIWAAGQTAPTPVSLTSTTGSYFPTDVDFAPGDFIELWGPGTADADFADVSITFRIRRL